jgi:hypothetical protein
LREASEREWATEGVRAEALDGDALVGFEGGAGVQVESGHQLR